MNRSNIDMGLTDDDTAACEGAEHLRHVYDDTNGNDEKHGVLLQFEAVW